MCIYMHVCPFGRIRSVAVNYPYGLWENLLSKKVVLVVMMQHLMVMMQHNI